MFGGHFEPNCLIKNIPESTLNKKHDLINYHIVCESVSARMMGIAKEDTSTNIAGAFTKYLYRSKSGIVAISQGLID